LIFAVMAESAICVWQAAHRLWRGVMMMRRGTVRGCSHWLFARINPDAFLAMDAH
jgi:hypothetical protein